MYVYKEYKIIYLNTKIQVVKPDNKKRKTKNKRKIE